MQSSPAPSLQLYAATLQYLQLSRGSKLATSCAPAVLAALLQGWGTPAEAVAVLDQVSGRAGSGGWWSGVGVLLSVVVVGGKKQRGDVGWLDAAKGWVRDGRMGGWASNPHPRCSLPALPNLAACTNTSSTHTQSEELIERANAAVVAEAGPALVEALAADALNGSAPPLGQAVSLHLLRALLAVDSAHYGASSASSAPGSGAAAAASMAASAAAAAAAAGSAGAVVAAAAYSQGVPQQLLGQLAALPPSALTAAGKRARRSVHVLEAALALLAALAAAGPPAARAAAAQQLYSLNALTALNRCVRVLFVRASIGHSWEAVVD